MMVAADGGSSKSVGLELVWGSTVIKQAPRRQHHKQWQNDGDIIICSSSSSYPLYTEYISAKITITANCNSRVTCDTKCMFVDGLSLYNEETNRLFLMKYLSY